MLMTSRTIAGLLAFALLGGDAAAQVPPRIAAELLAMGRRIEPAATAALYRPLHSSVVPRGVRITRDIAYGPGEKEKFDLFTTASARARPIVIFLHGGAFRMGDKRLWSDGSISPFYDNFMLWSVRHGMVGIDMNYTLAPEATYPTVQRQMARVVAWARAHAREIGGDPNQIVLWGHSAGATHVATYLAHPELYRDIPGAEGPIAAGILLSGIYDMRAATVPHIYFGEVPMLGERSSLQGLLALRVPLFVGAAELDPPNLSEQFDLIQAELAKTGHKHAAVLAKDHGHMSEAYAINTADTSVTGPLFKFLRTLPGWTRRDRR